LRLSIPPGVAGELEAVLREAGGRETGGILMGEQLESGVFRLERVSIQDGGGHPSSFVRDAQAARRELDRFFEDTGHDYARHNYLGEWHSHASLPPWPSRRDEDTMRDLIDDPQVGSNFAVLLVMGIDCYGRVRCTAEAYLPGGATVTAKVACEERRVVEG
jgi:proteasome lid subunit RPN8/RPN11